MIHPGTVQTVPVGYLAVLLGRPAVASLAPDASQIPVRQVLEAVQPLPLQAQAEALDVHSFKLFRSETTRSNDTPEALLRRLGLVDPLAAAFVRSDATARQALLGRAGRNVTIEANDREEPGWPAAASGPPCLRPPMRPASPTPLQLRLPRSFRAASTFTARCAKVTVSRSSTKRWRPTVSRCEPAVC